MSKDFRKDFPIFEGNNTIYFDNAATTQRPRQVIEAIQGPVYVATCGTAGPEGAACPFRPECHFNPVWCNAERMLRAYHGVAEPCGLQLRPLPPA